MGSVVFHIILAAMGSPAWGQAFSLMNPDTPEQAVIQNRGNPVTVTIDHAGNQKLSCKFPAKTTGWVVASEGARRLVVFDSRQFAEGCNTSIPGAQMVWIDESQIQIAKKSLSALFIEKKLAGSSRDAVCKALESLEDAPSIRNSLGAVSPECTGNCGTNMVLLSADLTETSNLRELGNFHLGNRCLIKGKDLKDDPTCSFKAMINRARVCSGGTAEEQRRCVNQCVENLKKMACENSAWRKLKVDQRFELLMEIGQPYAVRNGVDPRYAPCLASAETHYLEPLAKAHDSCGDERMYTSAGLGMTNATTLDHLIAIGFRSSNPWLKKPSYYVCKNKMFDILGSSADLQLEIMAFHMADNLKGRSPSLALAGYRGCKKDEPCAYAGKILSCVRCLKERVHDDGTRKSKADPLECLSAAPEGSDGIPSPTIYTTYNQYKALCEPSGGGSK